MPGEVREPRCRVGDLIESNETCQTAMCKHLSAEPMAGRRPSHRKIESVGRSGLAMGLVASLPLITYIRVPKSLEYPGCCLAQHSNLALSCRARRPGGARRGKAPPNRVENGCTHATLNRRMCRSSTAHGFSQLHPLHPGENELARPVPCARGRAPSLMMSWLSSCVRPQPSVLYEKVLSSCRSRAPAASVGRRLELRKLPDTPTLFLIINKFIFCF